jgi:hypothetical protein
MKVLCLILEISLKVKKIKILKSLKIIFQKEIEI